MSNKLLTKEQHDFLIENVTGRTVDELTKLINDAFNLDLKQYQIKAYKKNHKLKSGVDSTFKKGILPHNKGEKMPGAGKGTWFERGHLPHNWVPIGSERVNGDGYVDIKIAEGKHQGNWRAKHTLIWEEHNGPLPKGHGIIFGDGDKRNFDIDNLICVTRKQLMTLNRLGLITNNADLTRSSVLVADLIFKINEKKR